MYVCTRAHASVHVHTRLCACVRVHTRPHICVYVHITSHDCVYVRIRPHVCVCVCVRNAVRHGRSPTARQQTAASAAPSPPDSPTPQWGSPLPPSPLETLLLLTSPFQPPLQIPPPPQLVSTLPALVLFETTQCPPNWSSCLKCAHCVHTFPQGGSSGGGERGGGMNEQANAPTEVPVTS